MTERRKGVDNFQLGDTGNVGTIHNEVPEDIQKARRVVVRNATDKDDAKLLLEAVGLLPGQQT